MKRKRILNREITKQDHYLAVTAKYEKEILDRKLDMNSG